jgi:hypothetical protein
MVRLGMLPGARAIAALLLLIVVLPAIPTQRVTAASFIVSNTGDSGAGSLRNAITQANGAPGSTITFAIAGAGLHTIALSSALPNLAASVTIDATTQPGYGGMPLVAVDGQNTVTPFITNPGTTVRMRGLAIQHGKGNNGGGIVNNGALTLDNSAVVGNSATGSGGGIFSGGALTLIASTVSTNNAGSGGGIFSAGTFTLYASTIDTNTASGLGGGVLIAGGQAQTIANSTIAGNSGTAGGGIDNQGKLAITSSTVSGNTATTGSGGGIKAEPTGISATLANTIVAQNLHGGPDDLAGTFVSGGHNLVGTISGSGGIADGVNGDIVAPAPLLGALGNNGGPTQTIALQGGSPAIGAGSTSICAAPPISNLDQRGLPRPAACAIGAFDVQKAVQSLAVTPGSPSALAGGTQQFTATATYTDATTQDVTASAAWSTDSAAIATIVTGFTNANPGQAAGMAAGSATITAQFGGKSNTATLTVTNPVPAITGFTPATATTTSGAYTLTVNGSGFVPASQVVFNSTGLTTTYLSATQVQGAVPAGLLTTPGSANITVVNPTPGGGTSNAHVLQINAGVVATFALSGFPTTTVAGVTHTLTITAKDLAGNTATGYSGAIHLTSSDFTASLPLSVQLTNGVGSVPATLKTVGTQTISAFDAGPPTIVSTQTGITVTAAPAAIVTANPGTTPQSAKVDTAFTTPLTAKVTDAFGNVLSGVNVTFAAPTTGASGSFAGTTTVATNASGVATAPIFTANATAGSYSITATASGVATPAAFAMTNTPGAPGSILATTGNPQSGVVGGTFAYPFTALIKDGAGNPVAAGVSVTFAAPASGAGGAFAGGGTTATVQTVTGGTATSPAFKANGIAGSYSVAASASGVATPALFALTNTAGPAALIAQYAGTPQSAPVMTAFATALAVRVTDASGNPVSGATVTFAVPTSGASGAFAGGVKTATTNGAGIATAPAFTANGTVGDFILTASVTGASGTAVFSLTNTPGPVASFALSTATGASNAKAAGGGSVVTTQAGNTVALTVTALDGNGNTATNYAGTIRFTSSDPNAKLPAPYTFTTVDAGVHSFSLIFAGAGNQGVTVSDISGSAATGTATITVSAVPSAPPVTVSPAPSSPTTAATTAPTATTTTAPTTTAQPAPAPPPVALPAPALPTVTDPAAVSPFAPLASFGDSAQCQFFAETRHSLCFGFFGYWQQHGGVPLFGMPISEEFQERGADGTTRTVQYLERARFEYHPEFKGTVYEVELGLLAGELVPFSSGGAPFAPVGATDAPAGARFFTETRHSLADPFAAYWDANGGLPVFGFPISEPFQEKNADTGQMYLVQYFERHRLEYHPETKTVELGRLGVQDAQMRGYLPH